ncbi:hypothetical protein D3C86_1913960 [compost metagenome]
MGWKKAATTGVQGLRCSGQAGRAGATGLGASELQHVPDAGGGIGFSAVLATSAAARTVGRLHFVAGHVARLGLHRNRLRLAAYAQFVDPAARVFDLDALGALVATARQLLRIL